MLSPFFKGSQNLKKRKSETITSQCSHSSFLRTDMDLKEFWRLAKKENSFLRTDVNFKKDLSIDVDFKEIWRIECDCKEIWSQAKKKNKNSKNRCGFDRNLEVTKK